MYIRLMTLNDYNDVFILWNGTAGVGMRSLDDSKEGMALFLKRNPKTCFVAVEEQKIVGTIISGHDGRRGYIYHTCVNEDNRKQGIGKKLVQAVLFALKNEKINKVALVAFSNNELAKSFWQAIGFERREDLYYYNKSLNDQNI